MFQNMYVGVILSLKSLSVIMGSLTHKVTHHTSLRASQKCHSIDACVSTEANVKRWRPTGDKALVLRE